MAFITVGGFFGRNNKWTNLSTRVCRGGQSSYRRVRAPKAIVVDIQSQEVFDQVIAAGKDDGSLVVIDFSTTWCGPCKLIAPKFEEMSEQFENVVFAKVMGDVGEAAPIMTKQGIRAVPAFQFWKNGELVDSFTGAKIELLESTIAQNA